jgi:hypothetical protein
LASDPTCGERLALLVREELTELRAQIAHARRGRDRAVHKARKALQRLRAILLLFRVVDETLVLRENLAMRTLRRKLAPLRDAAARSETFRLLATRKRWKQNAPELRELAAIESKRHAEAWAMHPADSDFWDLIERARSQLTERAQRWPYDRVDRHVVAAALERGERRLRKRARAARGAVGRELRHELRRKLRRYANLERAAARARDQDDGDVKDLLSLAKRCGHEGDLWLAIASVRRAARERPAWRVLATKLEDARREQCARHDELLHEHDLA